MSFKTVFLVLCVIATLSCKAKTSTSSPQPIGTLALTKAGELNLVASEYSYSEEKTEFTKTGEDRFEMPGIDRDKPDKDAWQKLPISDDLKRDLSEMSAIVLLLTGKGSVWKITETDVSLFMEEGCHPFALIVEDNAPILVTTKDFDRIDDLIGQLFSSFAIFSAGEMCINKEGILTEVSNKSQLGLPQYSNANFEQLFNPANSQGTGLKLEGIFSSFFNAAKGKQNPKGEDPRAKPPEPASTITFAKRIQTEIPNEPVTAPSRSAKGSASPQTDQKWVDTLGATLKKRPDRIDKVKGYSEHVPLTAGKRYGYNELGYKSAVSYLKMFHDFKKGTQDAKLPATSSDAPLKIEGVGELHFLTGAQANIYVLKLDTGKEIIVKEFREGNPTFGEFDHEASMMRQFLDRDDYVHYYGSVSGVRLAKDPDTDTALETKFIFMQKADGDMVSFFKDEKFTPAQANKAILQVIGQVKAGHDLGIVFADLKLNNLLFRKNFKTNQTYLEEELYTVYMSDLGAATKHDSHGVDEIGSIGVGTKQYLAPELVIPDRTVTDMIRNNPSLIDTIQTYRKKIGDGSVDLTQNFRDKNAESTSSTVQGLLSLSDDELRLKIQKASSLNASSTAGLSSEEKTLKNFISQSHTYYRDNERARLVEVEMRKGLGPNYDIRASDIPELGHIIYGLRRGKILFDEFDPPPPKCVGCFDSTLKTPSYPEINKFLDDEIASLDTYIKGLGPSEQRFVRANQQELDTLKLVKRTFEDPSTRPTVDEVLAEFQRLST